MLPHENKSSLELHPVEVSPYTRQHESPGGDGLQVPPRHLEDQTSVVWYHSDDLWPSLHTTDTLVKNRWLVTRQRREIWTRRGKKQIQVSIRQTTGYGNVNSVLPSILYKLCRPCKPSVMVTLWCGKRGEHYPLMWTHTRSHPPIMPSVLPQYFWHTKSAVSLSLH